MTLSISDFSRASFFILLCATMLPLWAQSCDPAPGNQYEKIFCELKRNGKGQSLPNLYEFRSNPLLTQALLLKKPAERAGIVIDIPERANKETIYRQERLLIMPDIEPPVSSLANNNVPGKLEQSAPVVQSAAQYESDDWLSGCALQGVELRCGEAHFQLVTNQANQHLREGVLEENHKLNLPAPAGETQGEYLKKVYRRYLDAMVEIGLGASTMSYSKFFYLHQQMALQQLDFVGRFETMYRFLKKDKASIGVNTRAAIAAGFNTRYCSELSENLLACEYGPDNYLFQRVIH